MKKFLKITGIAVISLLVILYSGFLFVLPNVVDLNKFKPDLQKIITEQTNLKLDFENPKISVTPLLSAGVSADNIRIKLPDDSELLSADSFLGRISLPHLLFLTVKVSKADILNPVINVDIVDGKAFKAVSAFEEILNKKEENIEENLQTAQKPIIDPASLKILAPGIKLSNYAVFMNDLKTKEFLKLCGDELVFGYNNGESVSIKTLAELYINQTKNITANIDIDTFIPRQSKLDAEDDKAQRVEIPFVNPVAVYKAYDLKTNIDSKIKIRNKNGLIVSKGYLNVDNFTLNLAGMQLPESKLYLKTTGTKADIDSDLFITKEEKISLLGKLKYGKNPNADLKITSNKIYLNNVINLIKATLDSLHIKHELAPLKGKGYFVVDTYLKTDFKKLKSSGNITVKNCVVRNTKQNLTLAKVNSIISLENNILEFVDTSVEIAKTLFTVKGTIDDKSVADITVNMEKMPLENIFTMFLSSDINNAYTVNSGFINMSAYVKGELKNAAGDINLTLNNLSLTDKVNKIHYLNNILTAEFKSDFKNFTGDINNSDFKLTMNGATVGCKKFVLNIGEKDITILPAVLKINNATDINISGFIKNYIKNPEFKFDALGKIRTRDLKQFLGPDLAVFIKEKGNIPVSVNLTGDSKKQTLKASIEANNDNYITPADLNNVLNKDTVIQAVVDFKGDRLKIKDTGFFIKTLSQDPKDPEKTIVKLDEIVSVDGTVTKLNTSMPNINLIKVKMPNELSGKICAFPNSNLKAKGSMFIFGDLASPRIRGEFNIWDAAIPELMLTMNRLSSKFESKNLDVNISNLSANGSDYNISLNADLTPSKYFTITSLNLISNLTDADKLMKVAEAAMRYMPASKPSANSKVNTAASGIPVIIKKGNIDIKQIKTGNIKLTNTAGNIALSDNVLYVNNLLTSAFDGKIRGDVSMNLLSNEIKAELNGTGLDVEKTLLDAANMKDTLTGKMNFSTHISLKGSTYEEQMKSLTGNVDFTMKNGQLGPFGKLENLIMAENIRENDFFKSTIGGVLNSLLSFDTSRYNTLKGDLTFNDGITQINPITSEGDIMATYIFGNFDLLKNKIDIKLRGRLGSQVSDSMGPIAMLNPINLVKATPGMSYVMGKLFFLFTEVVTQAEIDKIPSLGKEISDNNATKFQVVIRGDVAKPLSLIKSFKWLALQSDMDKAQSYLKTLPADTEIPPELQNLQGLTSMSKEDVKEKAKDAAVNKLKETAESSMSEETKESIKQGHETAKKLKNFFRKNDKEKIKETLKETLQEQAVQALTVPAEE